MARKQFTIYKLTAPSGRAYVGLTGQTLTERWRQHVARAGRGTRHPLCAAIRKYGASAFVVEALAEYDTQREALRAEVAAIAELSDAYNLSPGGDYDGGAGAARFRELLLDPDWRAAYVARLSAALRSSPQHQARVPELVAKLAQWRADNPVKAYKISRRNLRKGSKGAHREASEGRLPRTPKGAAAKLHKRRASREAAVKHWANMAPDKKTEVQGRISASVKKMHEDKSADARAAHNAQLAQARRRIDHDLRKARQKEALAAYWTPERRAEFGAKVRARNTAKKANTDENL